MCRQLALLLKGHVAVGGEVTQAAWRQVVLEGDWKGEERMGWGQSQAKNQRGSCFRLTCECGKAHAVWAQFVHRTQPSSNMNAVAGECKKHGPHYQVCINSVQHIGTPETKGHARDTKNGRVWYAQVD